MASTAPVPADSGTDTDGTANIKLLGVNCAAPGNCTAVGYYYDQHGYLHGLIETLSGGVWTATAAPEPTNAGTDTDGLENAELTAVDCPSTTFCALSGTYDDDGGLSDTGGIHGLIETGSSTSWTPVAGPLPPDAANDTQAFHGSTLSAVSCSSPGACTAVGSYRMSTGTQKPLIDEETIGGWTAVTPSLPAGALWYASLAAVACPAAGDCVAVGLYEDGQGTDWGLIESQSAGVWAAIKAPEPTDWSNGPVAIGSWFAAVSCPSSGYCVAVGGFTPQSGASPQAFSDTMTGQTWTAATVAVPSSAATNPGETSDFRAVSCAATFCAAAGTVMTGGLLNINRGPAPVQIAGGYYEVAADGGLFAFTVPFHGSMGGLPLVAPIVGMAIDLRTGGYWEVAADGGIFAFTAPYHGSMGGQPLHSPIVGMAYDPVTGGYWEVAADGGIFAFTAPYQGSMGGQPLHAPIVGMAYDPVTGGYWEVAADGGIFAFTAPYHGSMGGQPLHAPIVGMAYDPVTGGYWEVAADGGIFAFTAPFLGSMGGAALNRPVVGMAVDPATGGYWEVASDGGLFAFTAPFLGSMGGAAINRPVVGMAVG